MARTITCVTTLAAEVTVMAPLRIGGSALTSDDEFPAFRDARGYPILPGTSLTGTLRAHLDSSETELDDPEARWGAARGTHIGASRVTVFDAEISLPATGLSRRDGVSIDRATGSAVDGRLYGFEVVPAGATANITVEVESIPGTEDADLQLLADVRKLLLRGIGVGARTTRGFGELRSTKGTIAVTQRRYDDATAFWSTRSQPSAAQLPAPSPIAADVIDITIDWRPDGPVAVGSGALVPGLALVPLMEPAAKDQDRLHIVVPGTSIAGALRNRAELICRTLKQSPPPDGFDGQLAANTLVQRLFGAAAGSSDDASWSAVQSFDCVSTQTLAKSNWDKAQPNFRGQGNRPRRVDGKGRAELRRTEHVAIDRWTGGVSDGRLFSELEPHGFTFEPIHLRVHKSRLSQDQDAAVMLLLVTVRDLCAGWIPLGAKTMRGLGGLTVTRVQMQGAGLKVDGDYPDLTSDSFKDLRSAWQSYFMPGEAA